MGGLIAAIVRPHPVPQAQMAVLPVHVLVTRWTG